MFYEVVIEDIIRIPPTDLADDEKETIENYLVQYIGLVNKEFGIIVTIKGVNEISEGYVVPEDGGVYHKIKFTAITYKPNLEEVVLGRVDRVFDFGIFLDLGPLDGLVHISQIMDDEVIVTSKDSLMGKNNKKVLKTGDIVKARIVTVSYKDISNIKVALTMKQPGLGKLEWLKK